MQKAYVALSLALAACGASCSDGARVDDTAAIMVARQAVERTLRDPSSAEFRDEKIGSYQGRSVVCGEVNSGNAFGGKSGFQRYVSDGAEATVVEEQMSPAEFAAVWRGMGC